MPTAYMEMQHFDALLTSCLDTWSLPGGHLEYGETFEECAKREVAEETGLEIENVRFLTAIESFFTEEKRHYVTVFMTATVKSGGDREILEPEVGPFPVCSFVPCGFRESTSASHRVRGWR